jgi:hypothetical protein
MVRPLNLTSNPLRLMLLLALLLLGAIVVGFNASLVPIQTTGSHSLPASEPAAVPNVGSQPLNTTADESTPSTVRIVTGSASQGPIVSAPAAASEPVHAAAAQGSGTAPSGTQGCQVNPPAGRGTPALCTNP